MVATLAPAEPAPTAAAPARCKIFTLWEYPGVAPLYARLNVEVGQGGLVLICYSGVEYQSDEPVLIHRKNVMKWILAGQFSDMQVRATGAK
ncbi:unnamed protein product [Symbiodinium natans]|uniref:Uncharacterized protein n=1 Tax=Symbiodinium natans TaxID=878477 RepID=A0A812QF64_9DINO|nr:unnamed protein product [Symbiodinium natans]